MNDQEKDTGTYVRMTSLCKCGCKKHCGHSCLDCDACTECECEMCQQGREFN